MYLMVENLLKKKSYYSQPRSYSLQSLNNFTSGNLHMMLQLVSIIISSFVFVWNNGFLRKSNFDFWLNNVVKKYVTMHLGWPHNIEIIQTWYRHCSWLEHIIVFKMELSNWNNAIWWLTAMPVTIWYYEFAIGICKIRCSYGKQVSYT